MAINMKAYITAIAAAAILCGFGDVLIPRGWSKYTGILCGAVMLITLISPLMSLRGITPPSFELPDMEYVQYDMETEMLSQFKSRVEKDAAERLFDEFGVRTRVIAEVSEQGVCGITLGCAPDARLSARLGEVYGCEVIFDE